MRWLLALLLWLLPLTATAQGAATLIADTVTLDGNDTLVARGNVEVFYDGTRLSAAQIVFDRAGDRLTIAGPIFIQGPDGTILTAERAQIDPQLENGILRGARLVLEQQLQLAANQIDRVDGRYSQLYKSVATSCAVCDGRPPLWDIRAERVIHDEEARQLYFQNAQFRVRGVPILWVPRMRLPDPSLDRATGLLIPRVRTTNLLGSGLKLPYFIVLGPSRDLLLTPYLSGNTRTLEARYRQRFLSGQINVNTAMTSDDLLPDEPRGYIFADGLFDLGDGYRLAFDIEGTSDDGYLFDYGYADKDRLDSSVTLSRVTRNTALSARLTYYQTLRADELNRTLPPITAAVEFTRRYDLFGGRLSYTADADALARYGEAVGEEGRDVTRAGLGLDWRRDWVLNTGLVADVSLGLRGDWYQINDAVAFPRDMTRAAPNASLTLRYPLVKSTSRARHLLEPMLALHWSDSFGDTPPNEDATRPAFDAGNLLSADLLPGQDRADTGLRGALGLRWTRQARSGTDTTLTFGRVFRDSANPAFPDSSGLSGTRSDWLVAGQFQLTQGFDLTTHALLADDLDPTLAQARLDWRTASLDLSAAYIWQQADPALDRPDTVSEWTLDGTARLSEAWAVNFDARYDIIADRPARAGVGVEYQNECVTVDLSVSRRYTSSDNIEPSTDYGFSVSLAGFSAGDRAGRPSARCTP